MARPFLTIFTRCFKRPRLLAMNKQSVVRQTCRSYDQIFLVDPIGRGVPWANQNIGAHAGLAEGQYVMVLDDDDCFARHDAIAILKSWIDFTRNEVGDAAMVIFKCDHGPLGVLPSAQVYEKKHPIPSHIGMCSWILRRDLWIKFRGAWAQELGADYTFLDTIWREATPRVWLEDILTRVQQIGRGRPE